MKNTSTERIRKGLSESLAELDASLVRSAKSRFRKQELLSFSHMAYCHVKYHNGIPLFEINFLCDQFGEVADADEPECDIPYMFVLHAAYNCTFREFDLTKVEIKYVSYEGEKRFDCTLTTPEDTTNRRLISIVEKKFNNNFNVSTEQEKTYMLLNGHCSRGDLIKENLESIFSSLQKFVDADAKRARRDRIIACMFGFWIHPSMIDTNKRNHVIMSALCNAFAAWSMARIYFGLLLMWLL